MGTCMMIFSSFKLGRTVHRVDKTEMRSVAASLYDMIGLFCYPSVLLGAVRQG